MTKLRTCVYAVSLNELQHVEKFMAGCAGADLVLVCDTGSTDGTAERLRELGATVYDISVKPWRFDDARNTALSLIPLDIDYCLSVDMDEYLQPGWVEALNQGVANAGQFVHRIGYDYVWNANATENIKSFIANKIHHRLNYRWRHPCHETLYYEGPDAEFQITCNDLHLHHHPDFGKSRGQYLPLLKIATDEEPKNDIMRLWYARELMFHGHYQSAIDHFAIHLEITQGSHTEERAMSMRFTGRCYHALGNTEQALIWLHKATQEWPHTRETWMDLARTVIKLGDWITGYYACQKALAITWHNNNYIGEPVNWTHEPHEQASLAAYYSGHIAQSETHALQAMKMNPDDGRLQNNFILIARNNQAYTQLIDITDSNLDELEIANDHRNVLLYSNTPRPELNDMLANSVADINYTYQKVNDQSWFLIKNK